MENEHKVSQNQLDVLKEIGTIGVGRAATALADLLGVKVEIDLPQTKLTPITELGKILGNPEKVFFVLDTGLEGDVGGRIMFLLPPEDAKMLGATLLGQDKNNIDLEDPLSQSSLKEVVNILVGSYMNALSDMTGLTIMYTVPLIAVDMVASILDFIFIQIAKDSDEAVIIETDLKVQDINLGALFLFFPDDESLSKIFGILGM